MVVYYIRTTEGGSLDPTDGVPMEDPINGRNVDKEEPSGTVGSWTTDTVEGRDGPVGLREHLSFRVNCRLPSTPIKEELRRVPGNDKKLLQRLGPKPPDPENHRTNR